MNILTDVATSQVDEGGSKKKRRDMVVQIMRSSAFIDLFTSHLRSLIKHNFIFRWQSQQFKECLLKFSLDVVVLVIDFVENYSFKVYNEIQSMHWWSNQVTILVHITYVRNSRGDV